MSSTETNKTVNQFLKEFSYIYFEDNYPFRDKEIEALTFDGAKLAFKKWLEQRKQEAIKEQQEYGFDPIIPMVNVDELIKELSL